MDKSVGFGIFQNLHGLFIGDIVALAGLTAVVGKITDTDAPAHLVIGAAFAHGGTAGAAGTLAHAQLALVLFQPVGQMLDVHGLVFHGDGLLHGDDVHADTAAARRHQMRNAGQWDIGHALEEIGHIGMLPQALVALGAFFHVEHLRTAGNKQGQAVTAVGGAGNGAVVVIVVAVVVLQQADIAHLIQQFLEVCLLFFLDLAQLPHLLDGVMVANLHLQSNICHFIGDDGGQAPVFRIIGGETLDLMHHHIGDLFTQLQNLFTGRSLTLVGRVQCSVFQFLVNHGVSSSFFPLFYLLPQPVCQSCHALTGLG